ncbi:MAG: WecB/TagA/CpsF family glycosyltransferase [Thermodesulfobacteriota bacterium]|nr:WecB/TagA/CpsF family glycosyltransferase [Thermodesulfobacteriota bacterium]
MTDRLKILDFWADPLTRAECLEKVSGYLEEDGGVHTIFAVNPEKNFAARKDGALQHTLESADLLIPDGIGVVLAARILYGARLSRVPGVEFMEAICALAAKGGYKVFFYGAREEVNKQAVEILRGRYPGLNIVGRSNGYVKEEEMASLVKKINASGAEVLFLALGSPKQENWISAYKDALKTVRVCQGIGGTLDTIAGRVKRAPKIWCRLSAEWLYRLLSEPRRIKRQKVLPIFAVMVVLAKLRQGATRTTLENR